MRMLLGRLGLVLAALSLVLAACTNHEPQERAAFIEKLQTQLVEPQLLHLAALTDTDKKAIGGYTKHYDVMTNFQVVLSDAARVMQEVLRQETLHTVSDIVEHRQALIEARKTLLDTEKAINDALAVANASRAKRKIPDDLNAIYERVFAQTVTAAAAEFQFMLKQLDETARDVVAVADFVKEHQEDVVLDGDVTRVLAPTVQLQLNEMLMSLNAHSPPLDATQQALQRFLQGGPQSE